MKNIGYKTLFHCARSSVLALASVVSSGLVVFYAQPAHAQAATAGDMICNVVNSIYNPSSPSNSIAHLIGACAYIAGAMAIASGLFKLREYTENPGRPPLHQPIARLVGGASLLALPSMGTWITNTLFIQSGGGGLSTCNAATPVAAASSSPDVWLSNFVQNFAQPMTWLVSALGFTLGTLLIFRGFLRMSKFGTDPNAYSMPKIIGSMVIGGVILSLGSSSAMIMQTVFGGATINASSDVDSWAILSTAPSSSRDMVKYALQFVQIVGMISFLRGWWVIKNSVEGGGQASMAQGITHIIGGVMCLNIFYVLKVFDSTFGTALL